MHAGKKLIIVLLGLVAATALLFAAEFQRTLGITTKIDPTPLVSDSMLNIPIEADDPVLGNPGAPLDIVMFGDLSCTRCRQIYQEISTAVNSHPADMRLIWKSAPLGSLFVQGNYLAHQAAYCAGQQGQFWKFIELTMSDSHNLTSDGLKKVADGLRLNSATWWQCANSDTAKKKINNSIELMSALGLKSVPTIFVNNRQINTKADVDFGDLVVSFIKK